jgi:hypothetical protein
MRPTKSTLLGMISTSLVVVLLHLCAVCDTDTSCNGLVGASLKATSFLLSAMSDTNSSLATRMVTLATATREGDFSSTTGT